MIEVNYTHDWYKSVYQVGSDDTKRHLSPQATTEEAILFELKEKRHYYKYRIKPEEAKVNNEKVTYDVLLNGTKIGTVESNNDSFQTAQRFKNQLVFVLQPKPKELPVFKLA